MGSRETPAQVTRSKRFSCTFCSAAFYHNCDLQVHIRGRHTGEKLFKCNRCNFNTAYSSSFSKHCNSKTHNLNLQDGGEVDEDLRRSTRTFDCTLCSKKFYQVTNLKRHIRVHTQEKVFKCYHCDFATAHSSSLRSHRSVHDPSLKNLKYKCDYCDHRAPTPQMMQRHTAVHTGEKPYACPVQNCEYRSAEKGKVKMHLKTHEGTAEAAEVYKCKICPHQTKRRNDLRNHQRLHEDSCPFACDVPGCNFRSKQSATLWKHRKTHFPQVSRSHIKCPASDCNFVTLTKSSLDRHLRVHSGDRPHRCELCEYSARTKSELNLHIRNKHTADREKTVPCTMCPKLFFTKRDMKEHMYTHTGEKPFKCPYPFCEFATHYRQGLKSHVAKERARNNQYHF